VFVHLEQLERPEGDLSRDRAVRPHLREIADSPQQPVGNAWRAAGSARDLGRRPGLDGHPENPGRPPHDLIEVGRNRVLVDAAHNPAGAAVLAGYLRLVYPGGLPLVFGAMRDKDIAGMLAALLPSATHLVVTAPRMARAADPHALAAEARKHTRAPVAVAPDAAAALEQAWQFGPTVCVAGSIFLAGEILARVGGLNQTRP